MPAPPQDPPPLPVPDPQAVAALAAGIDLDDALSLTTFGGAPQRDVAMLADLLLREVVAQPPGEDVPALVAELRAAVATLDPATFSPGLLGRLFGRAEPTLARARAAFAAGSDRIDALSIALGRQMGGLKRQVGLLDTLAGRIARQVADLDTWIAAGEARLAEAPVPRRPHTADALTTLERQVDGLRRSRAIAVMTRAQIDLIRRGHLAVITQLAQALDIGLPAWRQRLAAALALGQQREAAAMAAALSSHHALLDNIALIEATRSQDEATLLTASQALRSAQP